MAILEVAQLEKSFGGTKVLRDISFSLEEGQALSIIGSSGSGKTTLLRCLNFLETPDSGRIAVRGRNLLDGSLSPQERRRNRLHFGLVFQDFNLFPQYTALENVTLARRLLAKSERTGEAPEAIRREGEALLEQMGLGDRMGHYPHQLSGGQKQRVAIARALSTSPKYLLCDEATSALDPNTTRAILELLRQINRDLGVTIIIITHEMKVIDQICDRVAVIDHSSIAEEGKVSDVFTNPQSQIARELILPQDISAAQTSGGAQLRIIFSGESAKQPVLSQLTLECQVPVNILFADTKEVEGKAYGQMLLELPCDENQAEKVRAWLRSSGIQWKEESK